MLVVSTVAGLRARREELRRLGRRIALVPTMGALHEGHLSLVRHARGLADEVWVSVFVNPTQFGAGEDLASYPRDLEGDRAHLEAEGASLLFAPAEKEVYPRPREVVVDLPGLAASLCGAHRPGHFRGVALVVTKLFNMVQPDVAVFGAKDFQQAVIIRRLVDDLAMPVRVEVAPTVREPDGLAMSSRNRFLSETARRRATVLSRALARAAAAVAAGERRGAALEALMAAAVGEETDVRLQYAAAVDPETLRPAATVGARVLLALAAHVDGTRLIDNTLVEVS